MDDLHHVERVLGCDRVHKDKAMDAYGVFGIQNRIFILPRVVSTLRNTARGLTAIPVRLYR